MVEYSIFDDPATQCSLAEDPVAITPGGSDEVTTPLPRLQIGILLLILLTEPICSQCIYPFINQVTPRSEPYPDPRLTYSASWASQTVTRRKWATTQVSKNDTIESASSTLSHTSRNHRELSSLPWLGTPKPPVLLPGSFVHFYVEPPFRSHRSKASTDDGKWSYNPSSSS